MLSIEIVLANILFYHQFRFIRILGTRLIFYFKVEAVFGIFLLNSFLRFNLGKFSDLKLLKMVLKGNFSLKLLFLMIDLIIP